MLVRGSVKQWRRGGARALAKNFTSAYIGHLRVPWKRGRIMPERGTRESSTHQMARFAGVGFQFAGAILLFLFVGRWLDSRLGTEPWLLLLGVMVGAVAGFYSMYRQLMARPEERGTGSGRSR
jgi:F0F1-type ATP synthase assembly protein I